MKLSLSRYFGLQGSINAHLPVPPSFPVEHLEFPAQPPETKKQARLPLLGPWFCCALTTEPLRNIFNVVQWYSRMFILWTDVSHLQEPDKKYFLQNKNTYSKSHQSKKRRNNPPPQKKKTKGWTTNSCSEAVVQNIIPDNLVYDLKSPPTNSGKS